MYTINAVNIYKARNLVPKSVAKQANLFLNAINPEDKIQLDCSSE